MSAATKVQALKKLDTYTIKVGYPDHPRDYSKVVDHGRRSGRRCAARGEADWAFYTGRFFGPVDRSDWLMTPQTNDAYNGSLRDIVFPAGILQAPMFDADGRSRDQLRRHRRRDRPRADARLRRPGPQDRRRRRAARLVDEGRRREVRGAREDAGRAIFDAFEPMPGVHVNGELTMGENIADLGGLTLALDAYHASLHGKPAPVIDGLTGDQRVFLGWAQAWRGKVTDDFVRKQVVSDPHSPRQFRVNGVVRNIDAWYAAFDVKPGEKLYVAPNRRVKIW